MVLRRGVKLGGKMILETIDRVKQELEIQNGFNLDVTTAEFFIVKTVLESEYKNREINIKLTYNYDLKEFIWEMRVFRGGIEYQRMGGWDDTTLFAQIESLKKTIILHEKTKTNMLEMGGLRREEMPQETKTLEQLGYKKDAEIGENILSTGVVEVVFEKEHRNDIFLYSNGEVDFGEYFVMTQTKHKAIEYEMKKRGWWK